MAGSRRQFSREFKVEAVRQVLEGGRPLARVARELDISASVLRRWKQKFEEDPSEAFPGNGRMKAEDEELRRLRKEVVRLRQERDFAKNTAVFFRKSRSWRSLTTSRRNRLNSSSSGFIRPLPGNA